MNAILCSDDRKCAGPQFNNSFVNLVNWISSWKYNGHQKEPVSELEPSINGIQSYNDCLTVLEPPPASDDAHPAQELLLPAPPITIPRHADGDHVRLPENIIIKEKVYQTKV